MTNGKRGRVVGRGHRSLEETQTGWVARQGAHGRGMLLGNQDRAGEGGEWQGVDLGRNMDRKMVEWELVHLPIPPVV